MSNGKNLTLDNSWQPPLRNAKRLQRLADDILDVTKIESKSLKLNKEKININDVIIDVVEDYRDQIDEYDHQQLAYEPIIYNNNNHKEDIIVVADRERLTQVISNLLSNAIKFTKDIKSGGEDSVIAIDVKKMKKDQEEEEYVAVSVRDSGTGIDPEIFPHLFSRFASKSFAGTGLGLFISKNVIEAHRGSIWAENNPDGRGSTFTFTLPISNE